jgi:ketosteroid isomerase-like protein
MAIVEGNSDLLRGLYDAWNARDIPAVDALMAPDFTMHVSGRHPLSGTHRGKDEVWAYLASVAKALEGRTPGGFEVHAITVDDNGHAVALLRGYSGDFSRPVIHVWHLAEGLITEYWDTTLDQVQEDAFWNSLVPSAAL